MKEEKVLDDQDNTAHPTIKKIPDNLFLRIDGLQGIPTHWITDLGNCLLDMKRRMKTILDCTIFLVVS